MHSQHLAHSLCSAVCQATVIGAAVSDARETARRSSILVLVVVVIYRGKSYFPFLHVESEPKVAHHTVSLLNPQ